MVDLAAIVSSHKKLPVYDGYTGELLFLGQTNPYDGSVRDSVASWRKFISASTVVLPDRGIVRVGDDRFITGRVAIDFFQGDAVRENVVIHPCGDSYREASAVDFLTDPIPGTVTPFYGDAVWRKIDKDEMESTLFFNFCNIYMSPTEPRSTRDNLILSSAGILYRIQSVESLEAGFNAAVCSELGDDSLVNVTYTAQGVYDVNTDTLTAGTPEDFPAILELVQTNYRFSNLDAAKYKASDRIVTVKKSDVAQPEPADICTAKGTSYRVISAQDDAAGTSWELHLRRV